MPNQQPSPSRTVSRRGFLSISSAAAGSFAVAGAFDSLLGRTAHAAAIPPSPGFGPLRPAVDEHTGLELLQLPEGFRYRTFGWTGDPMSDGTPTPNEHDGMGVIAASDDGILTLCRNHEIYKDGAAFGSPRITYDDRAEGGCSNLRFDSTSGEWLSARSSLSGTVKNCAGGPTPWGTWLSCEESAVDAGGLFEGYLCQHRRDHGWVFEVPAEGLADPVPLKDMGRFVHEAVAVDPRTGIVYETEDSEKAGFYRFIPHTPGKLADGGVLEMLRVPGRTSLRCGVNAATPYPCEWVRIDDPQLTRRNCPTDQFGVFQQGYCKGGTSFARLEGCWYGNDLIYLVSTSGGDTANGQIWSYDPVREVISLVFESPSIDVLERPDNITVSPRGGIVLCTDSDRRPQKLHGLTADGQLFVVAKNNVVLNGEHNGLTGDFRAGEWTGATFSPDGQWLFANVQTPGLTVAITGPWAEAGL